MAEPRIKTTIEFAPEDYERLTDYAESHGVGLARAIGLLIDGIAPGKKFKPPTVDEVKALCKSKGYTFDPESFHAYYESKGWKIGREPMRKWAAACVTWQKREPPMPTGTITPAIKERADRNAEIQAQAMRELEEDRRARRDAGLE